jgi:hypothetical protein
MVPMEMMLEIRFPQEQFLIGTSFVSYFQRNLREPYISRVSCWKKRLPLEINAIK